MPFLAEDGPRSTPDGAPTSVLGRRPTVLIVAQVYPRSANDPTAPFMHDFARAVARDADVVVLAPHDAGLSLSEERDGVRIRRFRYADDAHETLCYRGNLHEQVFGSPLAALRFARFLSRWGRAIDATIDDVRPDVIHAHWWVPAGALVARAARRHQIPWLCTSHGTDLFLVKRKGWLRPLASRVLGQAGRVHAVSDALAAIAHDLVGGERVFVHPMPLSQRFLTPPPAAEDDDGSASGQPGADSGPTILAVGRLIERKGFDDLIEAYSALLAEDADLPPRLHLRIVGGGPDRLRLETLAQARGVAGRIEWSGALPPDQLVAAYQAATFVVMPSKRTRHGEEEGLGMVALEAMATGTPVVATAAGGIVGVIEHGVNGWLTPPNDPAAMTRVLRDVLGDPEARRRIGARARLDVADRFGPEATADRFRTVYGDLARAPDHTLKGGRSS